MKKLGILTLLAVTLCGMSLNGCAPLQTANGQISPVCSNNNTAIGAVVGGILGAGLGAAIGGGRGAAIGAASGAVLGGAAGAQTDANCRQLAMQQAMYYAAQRDAAMRQAAASSMARQQASYQPVDYYTQDSLRHTVTPLMNTQTDPVTRVTCRSVSEITYDANGAPSAPNMRRVCAGEDGKITSIT
jgi:outer membrane lipoprotein SlyB